MSAGQPLRSQLDHLALCATSVESGVSWFEQLSGVTVPAGGKHPLMATHNHLTALSENAFLEIIATDTEAMAPDRPRWFNLDDSRFQQQLTKSPRLATWVVGTNDLSAALAALSQLGIDAGEPVAQSRDDMQWQIALKPDGTLACDGVFPILIQWPPGLNPVKRMQDQNIRLNSLRLSHPQANLILAGLQALGAQNLVTLQSGEAMLSAQMSVGSHHFQLQHGPTS